MILRGKIIVSVNEIEKKPVVVNGNIEIRPVMSVNFTIDHRYADGGRAKKIFQMVIFYLIL